MSIKEKKMPKINFKYKQFCNDIWYTDNLRGWFIVKEENKYILRKGTFNSDGTIDLATKRYNSYLRLGDAKVGIEKKLKERVNLILNQRVLFDELKAAYDEQQKTAPLDYAELDKQADRLRKKWGLK